MVTFKEFFSFKNNRFFWLNLIAMVVVIVAAAWGLSLIHISEPTRPEPI